MDSQQERFIALEAQMDVLAIAVAWLMPTVPAATSAELRKALHTAIASAQTGSWEHGVAVETAAGRLLALLPPAG
ncbi:MAG: hypothetical protein ACREO3_08115 [Arenimonas sp.]